MSGVELDDESLTGGILKAVQLFLGIGGGLDIVIHHSSNASSLMMECLLLWHQWKVDCYKIIMLVREARLASWELEYSVWG